MFSLKLENESGNIVNLNDGERYLIVPPVSGLTPPSASIFTAKSPNRKGSKYNGSTLDERNIIITVKILGDVEANRNALYAWVDTEQYAKVHYRNGEKNVYCEGHIQDCEIDFFTDNEVVSLAILCADPYWKDLQEIVADLSILLKQFTFPFAIDAAGVPLSTVRDVNITTIVNTGAETGFKVTVKCNAALKNFELYDAKVTSRRFRLNYTIPAEWVLVIDTDGSPKTCKAIKTDGTTVNLMKYVSPNPTWFTLKKGVNAFGYTAESGAIEAEVSVGFVNKYLGV